VGSPRVVHGMPDTIQTEITDTRGGHRSPAWNRLRDNDLDILGRPSCGWHAGCSVLRVFPPYRVRGRGGVPGQISVSHRTWAKRLGTSS
jgi:hypothetical protein